MQQVVKLNLFQFSLIYLLLLLVIAIMKKNNIAHSKLLIIASIRMSVQLIIAGYLLTYIFENPKPSFTILYVVSMVIFSLWRVLRNNRDLNRQFQLAIACSLVFSGVSILVFFIKIVVGESMFHAQYVIPLSGMIIGNAMTGTSLAVKSFQESIRAESGKIEVLLNFGVTPKKILLPFVNQALETALLPTMNSMLGMGIVSLPGMMTGQILSGTLPTTAIYYQIAIMIAICTVVCFSSFLSLYLGYHSLYNQYNQMIIN